MAGFIAPARLLCFKYEDIDFLRQDSSSIQCYNSISFKCVIAYSVAIPFMTPSGAPMSANDGFPFQCASSFPHLHSVEPSGFIPVPFFPVFRYFICSSPDMFQRNPAVYDYIIAYLSIIYN